MYAFKLSLDFSSALRFSFASSVILISATHLMNVLKFDGSDLNTTDMIFSTLSTCCELTRRGTSSFRYLAMLIQLSSLQHCCIDKFFLLPMKCNKDLNFIQYICKSCFPKVSRKANQIHIYIKPVMAVTDKLL